MKDSNLRFPSLPFYSGSPAYETGEIDQASLIRNVVPMSGLEPLNPTRGSHLWGGCNYHICSHRQVCGTFTHIVTFINLHTWSEKWGSNPRPQPWQGCALSTELFSQLRGKIRSFINCLYHLAIPPNIISCGGSRIRTLRELSLGCFT